MTNFQHKEFPVITSVNFNGKAYIYKAKFERSKMYYNIFWNINGFYYTVELLWKKKNIRPKCSSISVRTKVDKKFINLLKHLYEYILSPIYDQSPFTMFNFFYNIVVNVYINCLGRDVLSFLIRINCLR